MVKIQEDNNDLKHTFDNDQAMHNNLKSNQIQSEMRNIEPIKTQNVMLISSAQESVS